MYIVRHALSVYSSPPPPPLPAYVPILSHHAYTHSAAPPSRPGFDGGVSPSRGQFPGSSQLSQATLYPISSLNPYQSKWTIRVRVASKPSIREWSNSRGQGKVFNVDLVDESVSTVSAKLRGKYFILKQGNSPLQVFHIMYTQSPNNDILLQLIYKWFNFHVFPRK